MDYVNDIFLASCNFRNVGVQVTFDVSHPSVTDTFFHIRDTQGKLSESVMSWSPSLLGGWSRHNDRSCEERQDAMWQVDLDCRCGCIEKTEPDVGWRACGQCCGSVWRRLYWCKASLPRQGTDYADEVSPYPVFYVSHTWHLWFWQCIQAVSAHQKSLVRFSVITESL